MKFDYHYREPLERHRVIAWIVIVGALLTSWLYWWLM